LTSFVFCVAATAVRTLRDEERYSHLAERLADAAGVALPTESTAAPQAQAQAVQAQTPEPLWQQQQAPLVEELAAESVPMPPPAPSVLPPRAPPAAARVRVPPRAPPLAGKARAARG
jgi:hypothetical protein